MEIADPRNTSADRKLIMEIHTEMEMKMKMKMKTAT